MGKKRAEREDDHLPQNGNGILVVRVLEATGVPPMDLNGSCDPYVIIKFATKKLKTHIVHKSLHPKWDSTFRLIISENELNYDLELELWDYDEISSDDFISKVVISLSQYTNNPDGLSHPVTIPFELPKRKKAKKESLLKLEIQYLPRTLLALEFWEGMVDYFDVDKNGTIGIDELHHLLTSIHSDKLVDSAMNDAEIFQAMDKNHDGVLTALEIKEFMDDVNQPLANALRKANEKLLWRVFLSIQAGASVGELVLNQWKLSPDISKESAAKMNKELTSQILVHNRETGKLEVELIPNYIRMAMKLMYSSKIGRMTTPRVSHILNKMTARQGVAYSSPSSKKEITKFIEFHHLNIEEMLEPDLNVFSNFNEFFYRKLKPTARPISEPNNLKVFVSPADCRLNVFSKLSTAKKLWIKGEDFTIKTLLNDEKLAEKYEDCSLVIARLAPQDYHRYHSPVTGTIRSMESVPGTFYTVNPIAINQRIDVYGANKRVVVMIDTEELGEVCFIAIGATMVGSIVMTAAPGDLIKKGDELGYFAFGGSTCLILFRSNTVTFDNDLLSNSEKPIETLVKVGTRIGIAN